MLHLTNSFSFYKPSVFSSVYAIISVNPHPPGRYRGFSGDLVQAEVCIIPWNDMEQNDNSGTSPNANNFNVKVWCI